MQNEKLNKELESLRKENKRLKAMLKSSYLPPETSIRKLEDELILKEEQLRNIYKLSGTIPWSYDVGRDILNAAFHLKRSWTKIPPHSKKEMLDFFSKIHRKDKSRIEEIWKNLADHKDFEFDYRYHGEDGKTHYFNCKCENIFDASGKKVVKVIGINQEITKQQMIKHELEEKEAQLHDAFELAKISAWTYSFETGKISLSKQLENIWKPPKENFRREFIKRLHPEDRDKASQILKHLNKESPYNYQFRFTGDDGRMYYFLCRCTLEKDENGKPLKVLGINWDITERKLSEKQTIQIENHLRFFFSKIGLGFWKYDNDTSKIYTAKAIRRFAKLKHRNELVKTEDFLAKIHFQDLARVRKEFSDVINGEKPVFDCIFRLLRRDDKYVWVLSRGVPIFDSKANVSKIIGCIEDLTQSKRYNALKERFKFMQDIADALPVPVYYKDLNGRYIGYNEAFKEFNSGKNNSKEIAGAKAQDFYFGYNENEMLGFNEDEKNLLSHPEKKFEKVYTVNTPKGDSRVIVSKKSVLLDSDDKPKYIVGGVFDITEIKHTQERLRQTTERLDTILNTMNEIVMCFDSNLVLQWANRAAQDDLSDEDVELTGQKWSNIWKPDDEVKIEDRPVYKVLNNLEDVSMGKIHAQDGHIYEVRAYPLRGKGKKINGAVEISLDITEHEAIKKKAEMHHEQLILADKMKSLGVLISGVAHEINNPNNFININITLLQKMWEDLKPLFYDKANSIPNFRLGNISRDKLEQSIDDLLFGIKDGSERISNIIESLKAYMRNAPNDNYQLFDLHDSIKNVTFLLKNQMDKATSNFKIEKKCQKLPVRGVQQKIEQVVINVLQNACQALTSRDQEIKIETSVDLDKKLAVVKIEDSGSGIDSHNLNYITDPFFTTKREEGGTGLGLSISSSILEEHKGCFNFKSEPGKGTVVEVILPLAQKIFEGEQYG